MRCACVYNIYIVVVVKSCIRTRSDTDDVCNTLHGDGDGDDTERARPRREKRNTRVCVCTITIIIIMRVIGCASTPPQYATDDTGIASVNAK